MRDAYDAAAINAVVLLTDGVNDDGDQNDDADQLDQLIRTLRGGEGVNAKTVRVFPIAYGQDADTATLRRIAEASNGALLLGQQPGHHQRRLHRGGLQLLRAKGEGNPPPFGSPRPIPRADGPRQRRAPAARRQRIASRG